MREELRKYADDAYEMVEYAANEIGQRVPGSDNETKLHDYMAGKLKDIGLKPKTEKFLFAPFSSIGGLPYAGWGGIVGALILLVAVSLSMIPEFDTIAFHFIGVFYMLGLWTWVILSVFKYKTCFDWCFKQEVSRNTYAELVPQDGHYDYTIVLSGHTDTSWTLKHSAIKSKLNPALIYIKIGVGAISVLLVTLLTLAFFVLNAMTRYGSFAETAMIYGYMREAYFYFAPFAMIGSFMLCLYRERNPRAASPGAMDNATGIALAYQVVKYFKENPDKMPKNCRIIDMNCGAEEAGLRGSIAFVRNHKDDGMLDNCWHINIDSIADADFFEVIHGDAWLCPHFDKDLEKMFFDAMKEAGIKKPGNIANPVGGCDSTPFQKAGAKSITFAAQNPIMANYYHTLYDVAERFSADTVGLGLDVILRVIDKIADYNK